MTLPGLRGVDHIGFTVPDLEQATRFLVDVLGCEYLYSLGPFEHPESDWMAEHLGVHPRAVMRRNSFFRCGDQVIPSGPRSRRATATWVATTSPCTWRTSTPRSPTCTRTACT
jgi:catechol 2,3-dioxygenase-like lactoylglutathione lyase family enzyme